MRPHLKILALAAFLNLCGLPGSRAQTPEAPPMEPPYTTKDSEFDPVLGEDPTATMNPVPLSPEIEAPPAPEMSFEEPSSEEKSPPPAAAKASPRTPRYSPPRAQKGEPLERGVKLIRHPDSKKGLMRIEADGTYVYKVKTRPKEHTGVVRFGFMNPPSIQSADGKTNFKQMYGSQDLVTLMADYEWQPFSKYGKLGVQMGGGVATASGNGRFLTPDTGGSVEAKETYNFIILPVNLGVIYRLEYFKRQWVAPYIAGGGTYIAVAELRDDGKSNFTGTPAAYGAGGIMFNITALDKSLAFNLDSEYGVGNLWLVAEYRFQKAFSQDLDFTGGIMSLGISADF